MRLSIVCALAVALAGPTAAHEYKIGSLLVDQPVLRVASPVSKTGAGFLIITNTGKSADRLLSVTTTASNRSDLHGTFNRGGVMQMRAQSGGVPIPAGGKVRFAPGGLHVMFIGLKTPVQPGQMIKARLLFEKAGPLDVAFKAETAASAQHGHH
ncbi:copper chaperone PCu(A)C [Sandarakinorhabdus sp. AAP62]|uniref:copper chaperone PCu(A)C n=1 Tax=Sandarakinorhabdus sp. AAP62 TaxID=1248916 RepID=UPI0002DC8B9D|nr:copper chaperone PCu(A)C [Sandarakinorhabdus sp. AAP62]